ncbi:MAG: type II toxin-antitoxin system RelE/ParE family toxin [Chloroherpetonaceae bacterium]|nr:type II toxin-antitoxin system RelE/ParE family toxin [Chloroherpetonaceae bacterium]
MNYSVKTTDIFEKQAKRLIKKYPSLISEIYQLVSTLKTNPTQGKSLGKNCYKVRISIASKGKGKSGGARLITNFVISENTVYLISIYDKSEKDSISDKELSILLQSIPQ